MKISKRIKKNFLKKYNKEIVAYSLLAFPLIWWIIFFLVPFGKTIVLSFSNWSMMEDFKWLGFGNYKEIFNDNTIRYAFRNTVLWSIVMLFGNNGFGLLFSFFICELKNKKVQKIFLALLYWPSLVSAVVGCSIQLSLFGSDENGIVNALLLKMNLITQPVAWFQNVSIALYSLMIYPFLFGFGMKMLLYYVGIKNIPFTYYEAANIETNSRSSIFFRITIPLLIPILVLNMVLSIIEGFKVIAPMQLIIPAIGGPEKETISVVYVIYKEAFEKTGNRVGYASAISMVLFLVILLITIVQLKLQKHEATYE